MWGTEAHLATLFPNASGFEHRRRSFAFRYRSAEHWVEVFRAYYGPTHKAFLALDANGQASLERDLLALLRENDHGGTTGLVVLGEYLQTTIVK